MQLLIHINLEFTQSNEISAAEIIEKHDSRPLSILILQHRSYQLLICDCHINEILSMLSADPRLHIQIMSIEI